MTTRKWDPDALVVATGMDKRAVARALRIDAAVLCRPLTDGQADRYAVALGMHPAAVWGPVWWA